VTAAIPTVVLRILLLILLSIPLPTLPTGQRAYSGHEP
jgi:hypothetical protein